MAGPDEFEEIGGSLVDPDALLPGMMGRRDAFTEARQIAPDDPDLLELAQALQELPDEELLSHFDQTSEMIAQPGADLPPGMTLPDFLTADEPDPNDPATYGITLPPALGGPGGVSEEPPPDPMSVPQYPLPSEAAAPLPGAGVRLPEEAPNVTAARNLEQAERARFRVETSLTGEFQAAGGLHPVQAASAARRYLALGERIQNGTATQEDHTAFQILNNLRGSRQGVGSARALQLALAGQQAAEAQQGLALADRLRNEAMLQGAEQVAQDLEGGIPALQSLHEGLGNLGDDLARQVDTLDGQIEQQMIGLDRMIRDLSTTRVDPSAFFTSRGSASTFAAMVNIAAGALSSTIQNVMAPGSNATNTALGIIERAVEREVEAQLSNSRIQGAAIGAQSQLINQLRGRTQDAFALQSSMRSVLLGQAEAQLRALGLRAQSDELRMRTLDTANALRTRRLEMLLASLLQQEQALRRRAGGGRRRNTSLENVFEERPEAMSFGDTLQQNFLTARRGDIRYGTGVVTDPEAFARDFPTLGREGVERLTRQASAAQFGADSLREIERLVSSGNTMADPALAETVRVHYQNIVDAVAAGRDGSVITESDAERFSSIIRDPASLFGTVQSILRGDYDERTGFNPMHTARAAVEGLINRTDASYRTFGMRHISRVTPEEARAGGVPSVEITGELVE